MQLILPAQLILVAVFGLDLVVRETLHSTGIELVEHTHLLQLKVFLVKVLRRLDTAFEHRGPDAEVLFGDGARGGVAVFGVGRGGVAGARREVRAERFVLLVGIPGLAFVLDEAGQRLGVSEACLAEGGVAANLAVHVVEGFAVPRDPDLAGGEVEVQEVVDCLCGEETADLVRDDFAADVDHLDVGHVVALFVVTK